MGDFNKEEIEALKLFRLRALQWTTNTNDDFLIRWLRARDLDLNKAEAMLKACVEWRKSEGINRSLLDYKGPAEVTENLTWKFTGHDFEGRPLLVVPFGSWEVRKLLEAGLKEEAYRWVHRLLEEIMFEIEKKHNESVTQFVTILDASGLTFWKIAHLETVNNVIQFFKEFESYYPETLHSCYIINTPWVFPYIFNIVKPLISAKTMGKVFIYDSSPKWRTVLINNLPRSSVPLEYR